MQRRNFLQLLGLGGFAAVAPVPVFGAESAPVKLWTPEERTALTGGHTVLIRGPQTPWPVGSLVKPSGTWPSVEGQLFYEGGDIRLRGRNDSYIVMDDVGCQWVNIKPIDLILRDPTEELPRTVVDIFLEDGMDPHLTFYKGAMQMRESIKQAGLDQLKQVPERQRQFLNLQLVTLVDNPIFAGPLSFESDREGFSIEVDYTQYLISGTLNPNGWEVYSETGEYPIDVPSNIDFEQLLALDTQVHKGELNLSSGQIR